jgi:hypothetical protein
MSIGVMKEKELKLRDLQGKWHVRVNKQSCKQANHLILWASKHQKKKSRFFSISFLQKLDKYGLTRPKVSKYSLTS